jgi:hypothetical protein
LNSILGNSIFISLIIDILIRYNFDLHHDLGPGIANILNISSGFHHRNESREANINPIPTLTIPLLRHRLINTYEIRGDDFGSPV